MVNLRVLHVISSYWPALEMGGPIQSVYLLNKFLARKGAGITVYTTNAGLKNKKDIVLKKEIILDGIKVFYFPYYGYIHFTFSPRLFLALRKNIKNFDLVHITGAWNFPVFTAAFWARFYKKPYIISPRGSLMKEPLQKKNSFIKKIFLFLFIRRDLKNASFIHFTAEAEKEEYLKAGLPLKKAIIIPNGFDLNSILGHPMSQYYDNIRTSDVQKLSFRQKFGIGPDKKIILFLGRLNWKKGLDTLIPAFARVIKQEPKAILVLAGPDDENYSKKILKIINNINNIGTSDVQKLKPSIFGTSDVPKIENPNIIFTGMLIGNDKISAFQESDVFVLPSYSENFGMAVVEAMYFGLPVIITKGVGISPSVERAGAGIVIEKDEKQLTEAILKILNNLDLAKKMGAQGRQLVEAEFSPDKIAGEWIKEYENIIKNI